MEFGLFQGGFVHKDVAAKNPNAEHDRLMSEVALCEVGDRHNWKYAWFTEHHFLKEYSHISASETLMAWVLARTQNIHVASGIINITPPVNHPARVAERVAMMDLVSNGRFEFGTGRGSSSTEMGGFGITDPEETRAMYDEAIREIVRMWRDEPYSYDGKYFSMPERNVLPKPYVKPHPPLWVAAGNPETFERAARMGIGVICFTGGTPEKMAPLVDTYKKHIVNAEPVGEYINDNIAITTSFMCLEDRDEARNYMAHSGNGRQQTLVFHYLDTFPKPPFVPDWPAEIPDPSPEAIEKGFRSGGAIVGTPDDCAEGIQKWVDIGVDQLIMGPSGSTYPHELLERTVSLFGDEVIPRFDKDPRALDVEVPVGRGGLMAYPTDGNDHPDLTGVAGEMRAQWRAEQDAATADAAAQWRHGRSLADWLRERMHAGDRIVVTIAAQPFVGLVEEVGEDLLALRCAFGRVEIQVGPGIPIAFEVVEHATKGGTRSVSRRGFRDALLARDAQPGVSVGTLAQIGTLEGTLLVGRDFVTVVTRTGAETIVPIAHVAWVTAARA